MHRKYFESFISLALIIFVFGSIVIVAQSPITGEWKADAAKGNAEKIHVSFSRSNGDSRKNVHGSAFSYEDLQGLTREQTQNGSVSFRLVREAGTIECEGAFDNGKGSGTFRFTPNAGYLDAMRSRGFDFAKFSSKGHGTVEDRLFAAATINVTTKLADDLLSADFGPLDVDDLFKAAIFKVDSRYMSEMKATGFPNLKMEDLVKARIFKIDADYVRQIKDMGFGVENFENLVKYRIFKVTPEFLNEIRAEGLTNIDPEDVVKMRIFNIDAAYVREARAADPNISVEKMVQKKIGVWTR